MILGKAPVFQLWYINYIQLIGGPYNDAQCQELAAVPVFFNVKPGATAYLPAGRQVKKWDEDNNKS